MSIRDTRYSGSVPPLTFPQTIQQFPPNPRGQLPPPSRGFNSRSDKPAADFSESHGQSCPGTLVLWLHLHQLQVKPRPWQPTRGRGPLIGGLLVKKLKASPKLPPTTPALLTSPPPDCHRRAEKQAPWTEISTCFFQA